MLLEEFFLQDVVIKIYPKLYPNLRQREDMTRRFTELSNDEIHVNQD